MTYNPTPFVGRLGVANFVGTDEEPLKLRLNLLRSGTQEQLHGGVGNSRKLRDYLARWDLNTVNGGAGIIFEEPLILSLGTTGGVVKYGERLFLEFVVMEDDDHWDDGTYEGTNLTITLRFRRPSTQTVRSE